MAMYEHNHLLLGPQGCDTGTHKAVLVPKVAGWRRVYLCIPLSILQGCELELRTKFDDPHSHLALLSFIYGLTNAIAEGHAGFILDVAEL